MDIPRLKLLAGRVRGFLQQSSCLIGHSQSLDLIAALPGLRNWPEVMAFPDRLAACELDAASAGRLAYRLNKNFAQDLTSKDLLVVLTPDSVGDARSALQVWPGGPSAGVYVTTSASAVGELLTRYEEATDGGLVYAERAGNNWEGSIDLGEYGLWSSGIDRLPSGTLLVVGPIELDQQSWEDAAKRLEIACLHALNSDHRVAVLVDTPTPHTLCEDLVLLVRSAMAEADDTDTALVGVVTEEGELERRNPFAIAYRKPIQVRTSVGLDALPDSTRERLRRELAARTAGIVLFGASRIIEHTAYDQVAAGLALTEHAGPAARIMARHRSTPAKDWLVPEAIKALPFLPSIASAYAQGYRRMVIDPLYAGQALLECNDVLFLCGTYGHDVADIALGLIARSGGRESGMLERIIAVLGLLQVSGKQGQVVASDLFIRGTSPVLAGTEWDQFEAFLRENRVVRWEDELAFLLDSGAITVAAIKKGANEGSRRHSDLLKFLAQRRNTKKAS